MNQPLAAAAPPPFLHLGLGLLGAFVFGRR